MANFLILTRFSAVLWHIPNNNILFKEASCEEKRPWCCRRPIKTWQNRHLSTYSSLRSLKSSVKACIILSLSSLLLRGLQTVKLIEELDLRQKKFNIFPLGGPPIGSAQNARLVNCELPNALTRFHGDLAQVVNCRVCPECAPGQLWAPHCPHEIPRRPGPRSELSGPPRMRAWSIVCSSLPSQDVALPPNLPF